MSDDQGGAEVSGQVLVRTRRSLHAVAEHVLAGPQHRAHGTIRLQVVPGGFGTVAGAPLMVVGTDLVHGDRTHPLDGRTARELGAAVGLEAGAPVDVYGEGSDLGLDVELEVDPSAVRLLLAAYTRGDQALRLLAPDETPVLWPEHFDVAIRVDDVNYGVSPGDSFLAEPYAYVGVDPVPADEGFWNAPFGAAVPMSWLADTAATLAFLADGRRRWS